MIYFSQWFPTLFQGIWKRITHNILCYINNVTTCNLWVNYKYVLVRYKCCVITDGPKNISSVTDILVPENCIIGSFMIYILHKFNLGD